MVYDAADGYIVLFGFESDTWKLAPALLVSQLGVDTFFTDGSLSDLPLNSLGNPGVTVVLAHGSVRSTNPGTILAWVNVTNTFGSSLQSLKLDDTLPVDWAVSPRWIPSVGSIHVFFANSTSLSANPDITQASTITVSTGNPQVIHLAISNFMPGQSLLLSVKLRYGLVGTTQSATSYPRTYTDNSSASAWTQGSYSGAQSTGNGSAFFVADAEVVS
jgi:hypothetical protein